MGRERECSERGLELFGHSHHQAHGAEARCRKLTQVAVLGLPATTTKIACLSPTLLVVFLCDPAWLLIS